MRSPPFLVGAALVFWGFETGLLPVGAVLALAAESPRWTGWRWDFDDSSVGRVFTLCLIFVLGVTAYRLATGWFNHPTWFLVKWLPPVVLPMYLLQRFSARGRINVWALSPLIRKAAGVPKDTVLLADLSFFCFAAILLAAAAANRRGPLFYPTAVGLLAYALFPMRSRRYPAWVWAVLFVLAGGAGYGVHSGLFTLQAVLERHGLRLLTRADDPFMAFTRLGHVQELKPSSRIIFWVRSKTAGYHYLKEAVYDGFTTRRNTVWKTSARTFSAVPYDKKQDTWLLARAYETGTQDLEISLDSMGGKSLLKLPLNTVAVKGPPPAAAMAKTRLGCVRIKGEGRVFYTPVQGQSQALSPPPAETDLFLPETKTMDRVKALARQLHLAGQSPEAALTVLDRFFKENFTYSLAPDRTGARGSPLIQFLFHSKTGHCEYFATASVLLLRAAGIPARYVFGYLAQTENSGWTPVRERHAHAWVLAHVGGHWVDFDTTPPGWLDAEDEQMSKGQYLVDGFYVAGFYLAGLGRTLEQWNAKSYLPYVLAVLILVLIVRVLFQLKHQKRVKTAPETGQKPGSEKKAPTLFDGMETLLNQMGYVREKGETPKNWLARLAKQPLLRDKMTPAQQAVALYYRSRFSPDSFTNAQEKQMKTLADLWKKDMKSLAVGTDPCGRESR